MSLDKITVQEAKQFIPLKENYGNTDLEHAKYFTLTPSAKGDGWENVTYYTDKKYGLYADKGDGCLLYTSPSPRDRQKSRMPSSA